MNFDADALKRHIPYYLAAEDQRVLVRELKAIALGGNAGYVLSPLNNEFRDQMLQGDGWRGFQLFVFETAERRSVRGLLLSNSCDVDPANARDLPARLIFAPLIKLAALQAGLEGMGLAGDRLAQKIASIRTQKTTNVFFLPAGGPLEEDHVVRLDDVHSMPVASHVAGLDREKLFTLSNTGFYMLVLKLSIHLCRLQENVNRKSDAPVALGPLHS